MSRMSDLHLTVQEHLLEAMQSIATKHGISIEQVEAVIVDVLDAGGFDRNDWVSR